MKLDISFSFILLLPLSVIVYFYSKNIFIKLIIYFN